MRRRVFLGTPEGAKPWSWAAWVPTGPALSWAAPAPGAACPQAALGDVLPGTPPPPPTPELP